MNEVCRKNRRAFEAYGASKIDEACHMFEENAQKHPCLLTLNNLGAFYIEEGLPQGDQGDSWNTALWLLSRAKKYGVDRKNLFALGYIYARQFGSSPVTKRNNAEAFRYFTLALEISEDYYVLHNLGVLHFRRKEYKKALDYFQRASALNNFDEESKASDYEDIIACLLHIDKKAAYDIYEQILLKDKKQVGLELCVYAYYLGEYEEAVKTYEDLILEWSPNKDEVAIIYDSYCILGNMESASKALRNYEDFRMNYIPKSELTRFSKRIMDETQRKKYIQGHEFALAIYCGCIFIDCPKHPENAMNVR